MRNFLQAWALALLLIATGCNRPYRTTGEIERYDLALDSIIDQDAVVEIIDKGFDWCEGPLWMDDRQVLIFSDVPQNKVYEWKEGRGTILYLNPSGYTGQVSRRGEMGSNGLLLDNEGRLVLCQHGDRRLARMDARLIAPNARYITIADKFNGKRFNSPNDAVSYDGGFLFTDPPYGFEYGPDDPARELPFQGVYLVKADGQVKLLADSLTRPNGIGLSPNKKFVVVANSDEHKARWYRYDFNGTGFTSGKVLFDATPQAGKAKGLPDGLKIDSRGTIFATGPGGVYIMDLEGKLLGKIKLEEAASNCALSGDGKTLFITNDMYLLRVVMR